jgi:hypothetical protein
MRHAELDADEMTVDLDRADIRINTGITVLFGPPAQRWRSGSNEQTYVSVR